MFREPTRFLLEDEQSALSDADERHGRFRVSEFAQTGSSSVLELLRSQFFLRAWSTPSSQSSSDSQRRPKKVFLHEVNKIGQLDPEALRCHVPNVAVGSTADRVVDLGNARLSKEADMSGRARALESFPDIEFVFPVLVRKIRCSES
jgi:hypothetical protein